MGSESYCGDLEVSQVHFGVQLYCITGDVLAFTVRMSADSILPPGDRSRTGLVINVSNVIVPLIMGNALGNIPRIDCPTTDFPEPLSPTKHSVSPANTSKETSETASDRSPPCGKAIVKPVMESSGAKGAVCLAFELFIMA